MIAEEGINLAERALADVGAVKSDFRFHKQELAEAAQRQPFALERCQG